MDFNERLKEAKKKSGLTTEEISEKSKIPIGTLNKIFGTATKNPTFASVKSICEVLEVPVEYIAYGPDKQNSQRLSDRNDEDWSAEEVELIEQFKAALRRNRK